MISEFPKVNILYEIDTSKYPWCNEAVIFSVKDGKGSIRHKSSESSKEDFSFYSQLILEEKPIMQGYYPCCPTCAAIFAAGYGTENIDCSELKTVRENINCEYKNIRTSAEVLSPLLGLLEDGVYILADVPHYPTDGNGNFFYSLPSEYTVYPAACEEYYDRELSCFVGAFPAFLYPTQSAELINIERIDEYVNIFKNSSSPPRGIAYYEKGFVSALIDGHHKACAAARIGKNINCLTIIRASDFKYKKYVGAKTRISRVRFAEIDLSAKYGKTIGDYNKSYGSDKYELDINTELPEYTLTGRNFPEENASSLKNYPTAKQLVYIYANRK